MKIGIEKRYLKLVMWAKSFFHRHDWYGMTYKEFKTLNSGGEYVCTKCGERRDWCGT